MNHTDEFGPISAREIDLLVDGQLRGEQRRSLLSRLEASPDGWRQCALAFLEAHSWRECATSMAAAVQSERPVRRIPSHRHRRAPSPLGWAAVALVAFTLGWTAAGLDWTIKSGAGPAQPVPSQSRSSIAAVRTVNEADASGLSSDVPSAADLTTSGVTLATVTIPGENEGVGPLHVPVYDGPAFDETWLRRQPAVLPDYVLRQLERRGFRVLQNRWFYPFDLQDGRHLVLPVDEVNVQFVGYESF